MISESYSSKELSSAELRSKIYNKFKSKGILDTVKVNILISLIPQNKGNYFCSIFLID